uniref:Uncharacterized protein n=1 Tax=Geospiza parvula TaxID=87175 RepID=A0A8U8BVU9_GEOPR
MFWIFAAPVGKSSARERPAAGAYLGNSVDLSSFDFRTGKMMPSKLQKNKQKLRNDALNPNKGKPDLNTTLPIRQTASIFKQPVTKVTNHPGNKVRSDPQRLSEQPRQVGPKIGQKMGKMGEKKMGRNGVGPGASRESLLSAVASALHSSSAPITGQSSAAVEKNPAVWLNTAQPLCRHFVVTDDDIRCGQKSLFSPQKFTVLAQKIASRLHQKSPQKSPFFLQKSPKIPPKNSQISHQKSPKIPPKIPQKFPKFSTKNPQKFHQKFPQKFPKFSHQKSPKIPPKIPQKIPIFSPKIPIFFPKNPIFLPKIPIFFPHKN